MFRSIAGQNTLTDTRYVEFCGLFGIGSAGQQKIQLRIEELRASQLPYEQHA